MPPKAEPPDTNTNTKSAPGVARGFLTDQEYTHWFGELTKHFRRKARFKHESEDLAQNVMLALLMYTDLSNVRDVKSYVYATARNVLFAHWQADTKQQELLRAAVSMGTIASESNLSSADAISAGLALIDDLNQVLEKLDPITVRVIELRMQQCTYQEIGKELALPRHDVARRLKHARELVQPVIHSLTQG